MSKWSIVVDVSEEGLRHATGDNETPIDELLKDRMYDMDYWGILVDQIISEDDETTIKEA